MQQHPAMQLMPREQRAMARVLGRRPGHRSSMVVVTALIAGLLSFASSASAAGPAEAREGFAGTARNGWGKAPVGGSWATPVGKKSLSVKSGKGLMTLKKGNAAQAQLRRSLFQDSSVSVDLKLSALPTKGLGVYAAPLVRVRGKSAYRLLARVDAKRRVIVSIERLDGSPRKVKRLDTALAIKKLQRTQTIRLEIEAVGTNPVVLRGKAWVRGKAEPAAQVSYSDASKKRLTKTGATGVWGYVSAKSKATRLAFDKFRSGAAQKVTKPPTKSPVLPPNPRTFGNDPIDLDVSPDDAGSLAPGSTSYAFPSDALFVSTTGSDSAAGTRGYPLRTLARAISVAPSGRTIVLEEGTYHESVTIPQAKKLTIQSAPGAAVWLDGSVAVGGFVKSGNAWVASGWTASFDASPTYSRGAPDNTNPGWRWVNPSYPMAAHPDQVWVNGSSLRQVGSAGAVTSGTFYVDYGADKLYIGNDPSGKQVRASDLVTAMTVQGTGSVVRGIGIRRYAPSVPDMGTLRVVSIAKNVTLENLSITDNATTGLSVAATGATINKITTVRNGLLGIHSVYADGLRATKLRVSDNNTERFNPSPAAGGYKLTRSRDVRVTGSVFSDNYGNGLWFDESCLGIIAAANDMVDNSVNGLHVELSSDAIVANNVIRNSIEAGLVLQNSERVQVWNNSISGSQLTIWAMQDDRRASNLSTPGHDPRQSLPDPQISWLLRDITISNNALTDPRPGDNWCGMLCLDDGSKTQTGTQMGVAVNGNLYQRQNPSIPAQLIRWANGASGKANYSNLKAFRQGTGLEGAGLEKAGASITASAATGSGGVAIPAEIADKSGLPAGSKNIGAVR